MEVDVLYKEEIKEIRKRKFDVNDIKSFVYMFFSMYEHSTFLDEDRRVVASDFFDIIDENILIEFPETTIHNKAEFANWHKNLHEELDSDIHIIRNIDVVFLENGKYQAKFYVNWRALYKDGSFVNQTLKQIWTLREEKDSPLPILEKNIVKSSDFMEN